MPTKSNNTGGRGGRRQGAGRKKTAVREKYENGNPGGRKLEVLNIPDTQGEDMPEPHEFLSARQHDGSTLSAADIYRETWEWLDGLGVAKAVSPQLLERYAMCSARWIQCEEMTTKLGYLSKHPTTGKPITSPFINIGINYMNQVNRLWNEIFQIVKDNCSTEFGGANPQDEDDKYCILPYFWVLEETLDLRVKRDHVPYDIWERQGYLETTEGNVIHYGYIEKFIENLGERFNIREIALNH
jgi:hypothetical protein